MTRRFLITLIAITLAVSGSGFGRPAAATLGIQSGDDALSAVRAMLQSRAESVERGDRGVFEKTMSGGRPEYVARQRLWFDRIRSLPLQSYRLSLTDDEFGDLMQPPQADRMLLQVDESIALRGFDAQPGNEDQYLTIVKRGDAWAVDNDTDGEPAGLLSMRHMWDFGPIQTAQRDGIMVVYHPAQAGAVDTILRQATTARVNVRRGWPLPWDDPIVIMVPSATDELARILQTTFDLTSFVAFAASSVDQSQGYRLSGHRVFLRWENFSTYSSAFQTSILAHEFLHLATRDIAGPFTTAIFDEGVAQHYGEGGGETTLLRKRVRAGTLPRQLVPDWFFTAGPRDDIFLAYEEGASFIRYLTRTYGADAGAKAYKELGTIDPVTPGGWRYHLDRVTQRLFKKSYADAERGWYDSVTKELK